MLSPALSCSLLSSPLLCCELCVAHLIFDFWLLLEFFWKIIYFRIWESILFRSDLILYLRSGSFFFLKTQWLSSRITEGGLRPLTYIPGSDRCGICFQDDCVLPTVADCDWRPQLLLVSFVRILRAPKCYGKAITGREEKSLIVKLTVYNGSGSTCLHYPHRTCLNWT